MKRAILASSLVLALGGVVACGTKQADEKDAVAKKDDKQVVAVETDTHSDEMAQEFEALPTTVVVRVPVDENGNEDTTKSETRTYKGDLNDTTALEGRFASDEASEFEMTMEASKELNGSALQGYDNNGYGGGYYQSYRPRLVSRILRGAAWVLSRPVVWGVRGFRYYRYDRPDCGCYQYNYDNGGYQQSTYVDVKNGDKGYETPAQQPYEPSKPIEAPKPIEQPKYETPAQGPYQTPYQKK